MSELLFNPNAINVVLPLKDGTLYEVESFYLNELKALYPNHDVVEEFRKMYAWCGANPSKRKTARGIKKFIVNWLNGAKPTRQDKKQSFQSLHDNITF